MGSANSIVFIDLGAYDGRSMSAIQRTREVRAAYLWEPNRHMILPDFGKSVHVIRKAAWVYDGHVELYLSDPERRKYQGQGSTLLKEKTTGYLNYDDPEWVQCTDFAGWLSECFDYEENVVVKVNIEGAEYALIERLASQGVLGIPIEWYISWHGEKVGMSDDDTEGLRELLSYYGYRQTSPHPFPEPSFEGFTRGSLL